MVLPAALSPIFFSNCRIVCRTGVIQNTVGGHINVPFCWDVRNICISVVVAGWESRADAGSHSESREKVTEEELTRRKFRMLRT